MLLIVVSSHPIVFGNNASLNRLQNIELFHSQLLKPLYDIRPFFHQAHSFCTSYPFDCTPRAPYIQAVVIPTHSTVIVIGDLHSSVSSLENNLKNLANKELYDPITRKMTSGCYLVLLGDYTDRGPQGVELWMELLDLKINNKDQVILLRGNHEDNRLARCGGFKFEWFKKFGHSKITYAGWNLLSTQLFSYLAHAALIGIQKPGSNKATFLLCTHAGIDPRVQMQDLLLDALHEPGITKYQILTDIGINNGFNWSDLYSQQWQNSAPQAQTKPTQHGTPVPLKDHNKTATGKYLKNMIEIHDGHIPYECTVQAIVRGHRHVPGGVVELVEPVRTIVSDSFVVVKDSFFAPLTHGVTYPVARHAIYTLTSSPEGLGKHFNCWEDAYGLFHGDSDGLWTLTPYIKHRETKKFSSTFNLMLHAEYKKQQNK